MNCKDWVEYLDKIMWFVDIGTCIVYWLGEIDVDLCGKCKEVFVVMWGYEKIGKVYLIQCCVDGLYVYEVEVW